MHRLIALWAWMLLLLSVSGDAFGVHPCPHHDAVAHAPSASAVNGDGDRSGHDATHHAPAPDSTDGHGQGCTCLGPCLTGAVAVLPAAPDVPIAAIVSGSRIRLSSDVAVLPGRLPFVLPYATAPPARVA